MGVSRSIGVSTSLAVILPVQELRKDTPRREINNSQTWTELEITGAKLMQDWLVQPQNWRRIGQILTISETYFFMSGRPKPIFQLHFVYFIVLFLLQFFLNSDLAKPGPDVYGFGAVL